MPQLLANNARALLTATFSNIATSLTVEAGKADLFPVADTDANPVNTGILTWYKATLEDASGNNEIVYIRTRTLGGAVFSNIIRAQESTTARNFPVGSVVELRITALDVESAIQAKAELDAFELLNPPGAKVQVGDIIMTSGSLASITARAPYWQLCDGTNGTPDLRGRMVMGAGGTYAVGATGGSKDAVVVTHTHTATFAGAVLAAHNHTINDSGHSHSINFQGVTPFSGGGGLPNTNFGGSPSQNTNVSGTGITNNAASAGTPAGTVTNDSSGVSGVDKNLPPYYALAFIMRVL